MKNDYIRIRLSERDKQLIREQAEALQMSMSEYIVHLVRRDSEKKVRPKLDQTVLDLA